MDITDPYVAYCFDEAVMMFGGWVQGELDKIEGKNSKQTAAQREIKLKALLDEKDKSSSFADPAKFFAK